MLLWLWIVDSKEDKAEVTYYSRSGITYWFFDGTPCIVLLSRFLKSATENSTFLLSGVDHIYDRKESSRFSSARRRVAVIAGEKVSVMICGATSVGLRCARTRGSPAEMVLREVSSIKICSKLEMKKNLFSGSTLCITTREGRM